MWSINNIGLLILAIFIAYLLGNISPSTIIGRAHGIDIKKEGSGNAGTTNTLRVLGKKAALITLVVDIGKGVLAVFIGRMIAGDPGAMLSALAVFLGHIWPVLLKFQGGKGVACAFGSFLGINWKMALLILVIVALVVILSRMVSLGSVMGAISCPILCHFLEPEFFWISLIMAIIVLVKHRSNIQRLIRHEESKISLSWFQKK